jgi:hypothetical protein
MAALAKHKTPSTTQTLARLTMRSEKKGQRSRFILSLHFRIAGCCVTVNLSFRPASSESDYQRAFFFVPTLVGVGCGPFGFGGDLGFFGFGAG